MVVRVFPTDTTSGAHKAHITETIPSNPSVGEEVGETLIGEATPTLFLPPTSEHAGTLG